MPAQSQLKRTLPQVELRIMSRQAQGYPVEFVIDQGQTFSGGYLSADLLPWLASASPLEDGQRLFNSLFSNIRLRKAWAEIRGQHPQRRIRLRIDPGAPELHAIPWELLRDASPGYIPQTLAADGSLPFSRYLPDDHDPGQPISERPLKMLVAIANPADLVEKGFAPIEAEREERPIIEAALAGISQDELSVTYLDGPVTLAALAAALAGGGHILHLIAHGQFKNNRTVLILADESNRAVEVSDEDFAHMVAALPQPPRLIYLVSCQSATRSPADAWRGLAPQLIQAGVPAVLAMQERVSFDTARTFTTVFYHTLLGQGGWVDLAANEARATLMAGADFRGAAVPVLFSRLKENRLFETLPEIDLASLTRERRRHLLLLEQVRQQPWFTPEPIPLAGQIVAIREDRGAVVHPFADLNLPAPGNQTFPATHSLLTHLRQAGESTWLILTPPELTPVEPLQQIAHEAAGQAEKDETQPVPVIFDLDRQLQGQTLADWLVEELGNIDQDLSETFARTLLEKGEVLVLLAGLERLTPDRQQAARTALNQFRDTWGQTPLVVSCSAELYDTFLEKLKLDNALRLIPPGDGSMVNLKSPGETITLQIRIMEKINRAYPVELSVNHRQQFTGHQLNLRILPSLAEPPTEADGERLFNWLLGSGSLRLAWDQIRQQGGRRHIQLRIDPDEALLPELPWELLRDPAGEPGQTLVTAPNTTFSRFYPTAGRSVTPALDRPLKVLVALANPTDLDEYQGRTRLNPEMEQALLEQVRFKIDKSQLSLTFTGHDRPLTLAGLKKALQPGYHILHFIGCAALLEGQPTLFLADNEGQVDLAVTADRFGEMLQGLPQRPQLVILSDGHNASQSSAPAWRKAAPIPLQAGIPAVVIIQTVLSRNAAYAFLRPLYEELVTGSGQVDVAMSMARTNLRSLTSPAPTTYPPILYTRTPTPHLFDQPPPALDEVNDEERRNQLILLRRVQEYWVQGVYEQSLQEVAKIELGMETQLDPVKRTLAKTEVHGQSLPPGQQMIDLFDQLDGALLILGAPGSGKTFALLELARDLIQRAERISNHPLPAVFNLSSWQDPKQSIAHWIVEELSLKYFIPRKIGRRWIEDKKILPLLDGLDEVKAELRAGCVRAINTFHRENLVGLVVCSRLEEYEQLETKPDLAGAVRLQPLTSEQIKAYLHRAGPDLAAVREALQHDEPLQELAKTPLMLNVMALAYEGKSAAEIQEFDTIEARRRHLFDEYVWRMFHPKARRVDRLYPDEQTVLWLSWLARKMEEHNQSIFLIEQLQPSWLPARSWRWVYTLSSRSIGGLVYTLSGEFRIVSMIAGLMGGLIVGLVDSIRFERNRNSLAAKKKPTRRQVAINILGIGLMGGICFAVVDRLVIGLVTGPIFGLIFGIRGSHQSLSGDIRMVEILDWTWLRALRGGLIGGLLSGLVFGSILILVLGSSFGFVGLLSITLGGALLGAMIGGVGSRLVETKARPNQGIRLTLKNAVIIGLIVWLVFGALFGLIDGLNVGLLFNLETALIAGSGFGVLAGLWYGGLDLIQHLVLRLILTYKGYITWNYAHFLDYAEARILLRKVGGGYIFIHRLFQIYFTSLEDESFRKIFRDDKVTT